MEARDVLMILLKPVNLEATTTLNLLGGGFLDPVLTGNLSTERDLDNLLRETNGEVLAKRGQTVAVAPGGASHLALVQLFLEVLHRVHSHHVRCQVIGGSDKQTTLSFGPSLGQRN